MFNLPRGTRVWSDSGFTRVHRVIRHRTDKKMYRVQTKDGSSVDVTEDHSLLDDASHPLQPANVEVGKSRLLQRRLPMLPTSNTSISSEEAALYGLLYRHGKLNQAGNITIEPEHYKILKAAAELMPQHKSLFGDLGVNTSVRHPSCVYELTG